MKLSSNFFRRSEFTCSCGCGYDTVDTELLRILDQMRRDLMVPIVINSGCRCLEYNRSIGSKDTSQHVRARAADIVVTNHTPKEIYELLNDKFPESLGLGLYGTFVHIDTRTNGPARWEG